MERKSLKTLIKEHNHLITSSQVFYAYEYPINGWDGCLIKIEELTEEQLNKRYSDKDWFIEDGDLCIKYGGR